MKAISIESTDQLVESAKPGFLDRMARKIVLRQLQSIRYGQLVLRDGKDQWTYGEKKSADDLSATITVRDPRFYGEVAYGGSVGTGESRMECYWECDDLLQLVRLMVRNRHIIEGMEVGLGRLTRPLQRFLHRINRNTRRGAKRNIAAHYDLGNDFFSLWLDESMMYSCAIFEDENTTLAEAQRIRLDRVCERLDLQSGERLVEIGTGWGAMAMHAAKYYGCHVTTTTISKEQFELARKRIDAAGLSDQITLLLEDYRDLTGQYDKLVSIEMVEAIGKSQYDTYFTKCAELLKPGGRMLIQAITIEDDRFEDYSKNVDFIQHYVFPGSCLPSQKIMSDTISRVSDMTIRSVDSIGLHYATTLQHWRQNFFARLDEVRALGYPDRFIRMWEYYLCYCEGGFLERSIDDILLVAERPEIIATQSD